MDRPGLVSDIVRACSLERAAAAVDAALQAIIQMCALAELQELMLQQGVLGYLVPLLLGYDSTLGEESAGEEAASAQLLAEEGAGGPQREVAAYLGLSMQRTNMQVGKHNHVVGGRSEKSNSLRSLSVVRVDGVWHGNDKNLSSARRICASLLSCML